MVDRSGEAGNMAVGKIKYEELALKIKIELRRRETYAMTLKFGPERAMEYSYMVGLQDLLGFLENGEGKFRRFNQTE